MEVRSVEAIVKALNDAGVEYLIVGGLAVNAHGFVRLTRAVGLVFRLESENVLRGLRALQQTGYWLAVPGTAEEAESLSIRMRSSREPSTMLREGPAEAGA